LPILPALAASSPIFEGRLSEHLDTRLDVYRTNCRRIPLATGRVIPERVFAEADYQERILEPLFAEISPHDPQEILQEEWLNARGAIARFERNTIEIRVLDVQECPQADVAVCSLVADVVERLIKGQWGDPARLESWNVEPLAEILFATIRDADETTIRDIDYLQLFGIDGRTPLSAGELWRRLAGCLGPNCRSADPSLSEAVEHLVEWGPLARRILTVVGPNPSRDRLLAVYRELADCLAAGRMFGGFE
jgi:glutamate---cysteine ligase / carboxylate-amine ligase